MYWAYDPSSGHAPGPRLSLQGQEADGCGWALDIHPALPSAPQIFGVTTLSFGAPQCQRYLLPAVCFCIRNGWNAGVFWFWFGFFFFSPYPKQCLQENSDLQEKQPVFSLTHLGGGCWSSRGGRALWRHAHRVFRQCCSA